MATRSPRQARSADKLDALRAAAGRLLIDQGPEAVTYRGVAVAAGLSPGSASYYFENRDELYAAAVEAAEEQRTAAAQARAESLDTQPRTADEVARLLIEVTYAPHVADDVVTLRLEPMLAAQRNERLRPTMAASRPRLLEALATVLTRSGHRSPGADDLDLLVQVIDAGLMYAWARGSEHVIDDATKTVARILTLIDQERQVDQERQAG
ncbi:TetR/AcrR family transcriptional regulator [Mumia zhuanghuii]|uniref:TetR/AcrR family transcriptional regulator n=2 Tax=Mumia TaxID=1546255 RepID=A0ABW1QKD4_9ACTN|nr:MULTISPECIES: TetR/AcrR family transcriptional regulator [Mumia]KAA1423388.1 TetR/AcrR family transcriptional regulator [Mumia zhuanghuii]